MGAPSGDGLASLATARDRQARTQGDAICRHIGPTEDAAWRARAPPEAHCLLPDGALMPQPFDSLKGFAVTFGQLFHKPLTQQYPEYKKPMYPRFRGRHRLWRHENGLEKCIGSPLCPAACPADCTRVVPAENTPDNRVSAGERYARIYEI